MFDTLERMLQFLGEFFVDLLLFLIASWLLIHVLNLLGFIRSTTLYVVTETNGVSSRHMTYFPWSCVGGREPFRFHLLGGKAAPWPHGYDKYEIWEQRLAGEDVMLFRMDPDKGMTALSWLRVLQLLPLPAFRYVLHDVCPILGLVSC